jgi:hypothetical protein
MIWEILLGLSLGMIFLIFEMTSGILVILPCSFLVILMTLGFLESLGFLVI